jgi:hypothetical protein
MAARPWFDSAPRTALEIRTGVATAATIRLEIIPASR